MLARQRKDKGMEHCRPGVAEGRCSYRRGCRELCRLGSRLASPVSDPETDASLSEGA